MVKKYLNPQVPTLADGDLMAVVVSPDEERATIEYLLAEGIARDEENYIVYAAKKLVQISPSHKELSIGPNDNLLTIISDLRENAINSGSSGVRIVFIDDPIVNQFFTSPKLMDALLTMLMKGSLSIARTVSLEGDVRGSRFFYHPRIMYRGEVMPNPLFIAPDTVGENDLPFEVFLSQTLDRTSISKGKIHNFPTNLPNLLESILDSVPIGIVAGDSYGNMVYFNKEATKIMGLSASPLPYAERIRRFGNFLPDKVTPYPFEDLPLSRAIRGEEFERVPLYIDRPGLEKGVPLESTGSGMYDSNGNLLGGVVVFYDTTELEKEREDKNKLEARLLHSQKMESLGVLAGGIAHDFNNLLVGVLGNASVLLQTEAIASPSRRRLMQIQEAGSQLADLTRQLLIYAGLSPAKDLERESLTTVVSVMRGLLETAVSRKVNLTFDLVVDSLWVLMEPTQLKQVLLNLVVNAADSYKMVDGSILVSTRQTYLNEEDISKILFGESHGVGQYAVLEVIDNGCGMSEEDVRKAFDPFYSSKGVGRGLGLSAVLGIVKNHNGLLEVDSEVGHGTTFRLYFPLSDAPKVVEKNVNVVGENGFGRVLIIDDEKLVLDVAEALLTHAGFMPICVEGGVLGFDRLEYEEGNVSAVIVDLTMPDMSGEVVYQKIRERYPDLPVIISSGFSKETFTLPLEGDPNLYFLEKPYAGEKLVGLVSKITSS